MSTDNIQIKDAVANTFTLRAKDVSAAGDGSLRRSMVLATPYPIDYGAGGSYRTVIKTGNMAAGLASGSTIFSFRAGSATLNTLVRRMRIGFDTLSAGFAPGVAVFDLFVARSFTASDTGGAAGSASKLRTSMPSSSFADLRAATTGALTNGTRTLDTSPIASWSVGAPTTANTSPSQSPLWLLERTGDHHPILLAQNEGLIIQANVPATGVWWSTFTMDWEEVPLAQF